MTKKQAKAITLEVWGYLAKHPEIDAKSKLPEKLWKKIRFLKLKCALCSVCCGCIECPLNPTRGGCIGWTEWLGGVMDGSSIERERGAKEIVRLVKAWKV